MESQHHIQAASPSTCQWVFQNRLYSDWQLRRRYESHHGLLWLKGKPGAGKSVLLKTMFRASCEASTDPNRIIVAHYFSRHGEMLEQNTEGMYRSLWHQIIQQDKALREYFVSNYRQRRDTHTSVSWSFDDLKEKLTTSVLQTDGARFDFFIDGIDECTNEDEDGVISFFKKITEHAYETGANVNICMSGRHYPKAAGESYLEIVMEDENWDDICQFAYNELPKYPNIDAASLRALAEKIANKAKGVFLWAHFAIRTLKEDHLNDRSTSSTEEELDRLPNELKDLFSSCFAGFNDRDFPEGLALWRWVLFACSPLSLSQLYDALAPSHSNDPRQIYYWRKDSSLARQKYESFLRRILNLSKGLLEVIVEVPVYREPENRQPQPAAELGESEDDSQGLSQGLVIQATTTSGDTPDGSLDWVEGSAQEVRNSGFVEELPQEETAEEAAASVAEACPELIINDVNIQKSKLSVGPSADRRISYRAELGEIMAQAFFNMLRKGFVEHLGLDILEDYNALKSSPKWPWYYYSLHIWDSKHPWGDDVDLRLHQILNARVQFIHDTAQEFFVAKIAQHFKCSGQMVIALGHSFIAEACYGYLHQPDISSMAAPSRLVGEGQLPLEEHFPLLPYCLDHFVTHCQKAESMLSELLFFRNDPCLQVLGACEMPPKWGYTATERIRAAAAKHDQGITTNLLDFLCTSGLLRTAQHYISSHPQELYVQDEKGNGILHRLMSSKLSVPIENLAALVDECTRRGMDINARNQDGETPLYVAVRDRPTELGKISLLLERGADPALESRWKRIALEDLPIFKSGQELDDVLTQHRTLFLSTGLTALASTCRCDCRAIVFAFESLSDAELERFICANPMRRFPGHRVLSVRDIAMKSTRPHFVSLLALLPSVVAALTAPTLCQLMEFLDHRDAFPKDEKWTVMQQRSLQALGKELRRRRLAQAKAWIYDVLLPLIFNLFNLFAGLKLAPKTTILILILILISCLVVSKSFKPENRVLVLLALLVIYTSTPVIYMALLLTYCLTLQIFWVMLGAFLVFSAYGVFLCGLDVVRSSQCAAFAAFCVFLHAHGYSKRRYFVPVLLVEITAMWYVGPGTALLRELRRESRTQLARLKLWNTAKKWKQD